MVLLDGQRVAPEVIDPARHHYIGMFRPAVNALIPNVPAYVSCTCGHILKFREESIQHYRDGCLDLPQYVTIRGGPTVEVKP